MIELTIDSRESSLFNTIIERDLDIYKDYISIEKKQLDIGDIIISCNTKYIFERKTVSDLLASVKDGRYQEQKYRLLSSGSHITYIIEGDNILSTRQFKKDLLSSIYLYSIFRDNIHLVFTNDVEETATFILTLCTKMVDKPEKFVKKKGDYMDNVKMKKIKNITPETCYLMQLSQIPSISINIARIIANTYPSLHDLFSALNNSSDKIKLLSKLEKIGNEKAIKILEYFHYKL